MNTPTALPVEVAEHDKQLDSEIATKIAELMELRWHWTLDETNPDRVKIAVYAREVGRARQVISRDANAWVRWLADADTRTDIGAHPVGDPWTPADFREAVKLSDERELVVRAVARANNKKFSNVAVNMRKVVNEALTLAQDRAEFNGTAVADEIIGAAQDLVKLPATTQKDARAKRKRDETSGRRPEYLALQQVILDFRSRMASRLENAEILKHTFSEVETTTLLKSLDEVNQTADKVRTFLTGVRGEAVIDAGGSVLTGATVSLRLDRRTRRERHDHHPRATVNEIPAQHNPSHHTTPHHDIAGARSMSDTAPEATAFDLADQIERLADSITVERPPPSRPLPPTVAELLRLRRDKGR